MNFDILPPELQRMVTTKEGRRLLSLHSPSFFAMYYLGYNYAKHQADWFDECESLMKEAKAQRMKRKITLLAPRDHGKSWLSIALVVRAICLDRDVKVLFISASAGQAEKRLRMAKQFLLSERIVEDWGSGDMPPFYIEGESKWINTQVYVPRMNESVDPTIEAIGAGGSITGAHPTLIICDDIEDDKTVFSSSVREKTREWLRGTIQPMLSRDGFMLVVGTRKHADDIYGHMIKDPTFHVRHDKAIKRMPTSFSYEMTTDSSGRDVISKVIVEGDSEVLWKEGRPIEYLLRERQTVGSLLFTREYQNEVMSNEAAAFKNEWLEQAQLRGAIYACGEVPAVQDLVVVQAWDLALITDVKRAEDQDGDYSVGTTWAKDKSGNRYLINQVRVRGLTPQALQNVIVSEYLKFKEHVSCVMIEKNAFGQLHLLSLQQNTDLPLKQHLTTAGGKSSPWTGVPSLASLFENMKVVLPTRDENSRRIVDTLCTELYGLGREKHDDTVMSLWIAECAIKSGSFQYGVSFDDKEVYDSFGKRVVITGAAAEYEEEVKRDHLSRLWSSLGMGDDYFSDEE